MISTLWFLTKLCFYVAAFMIIASIGGEVSIDLAGYRLTATVGFFLISFIAILWLLFFIGDILHGLLSAPGKMLGIVRGDSQEKALQSLALGLSAIAAGDGKTGQYHAKRMDKFLRQKDYGLTQFLTALSAKINGNEDAANDALNKMMDHKETSFLGLKGLLQNAVSYGDQKKALEYAKQAYERQPKQPLVIETLYNLHLQNENYLNAQTILKKAEKYKAIPRYKIDEDKTALLYLTGYVQQAVKANPAFLPAAFEMIKDYSDAGKRRAAINLIKKSYSIIPHPRLMDFWVRLAKAKDHENPIMLAVWIENLHKTNIDDASSALYASQALINIGQKDVAKRLLKTALDKKPTVRAYQLMHDIDAGSSWLDYITNAAQDKAWVCTKTGQIFEAWKPLNNAHDFNTIHWDYPVVARAQMPIQSYYSSNFMLPD
jgi:HemY protein